MALESAVPRSRPWYDAGTRFSDDASQIRLKRLFVAFAVLLVPLFLGVAINALMTAGMPLPEKAWRVSTALITAGMMAWTAWRHRRREP